jgi:hypothetical protein
VGKAKDQAGNIWETDAQGNAVRLIRPAPSNPMNSPTVDPRLQYQVQQEQGQAAASPYAAPKAQADAAAAAAEARIKLVGANYAPAVTEADLAKTRAEAEKARAELEKTKLEQPAQKQEQNASALLRAAGVDLAKGIDPIADLIKESTSGRVQHIGAEAVGLTGHATPGMQNIGKLKTIVSDMVLQLTGGGLGNQVSDADREFIIERVGNLADPDVPADQRLAAWEQVKTRMGNILGVKPADDADSVKREMQDRLSRGDDPADIIHWLVSINRPPNKDEIASIIANRGNPNADPVFSNRPPDNTNGGYANSYVGQALSGVNEGLAGILGAPVDLGDSAVNLFNRGINGLAGANLPTNIGNAPLGAEWWKRRLADVGSIAPPSDDSSKQFVRRVGESVGASAVPGMMGGSALKMGGALLSGLGGGIGGATAQQAFPGNPLAEMGGELVGGGLTGLGLAKGAQRSAQRGIENAIPTVDELKQQASNLYRQAEARGVTAGPRQTKQLATGMRQILTDEGQLGPKGAISNADTHASKAFNLIQQYAGRPMQPSEMNTIRTVLSEARQSADPSDRRLGKILLDHFDNWVSPMAPEFAQARSVASKYLQAQDLERARELAAARASQFTGSGFENALRTEYRGLDRGQIKGQQYFSPGVSDAVQNVARGTPLRNAMRGLGRLAPTGPVSGMGSIVPALGVGAMTSPATGGMFGAGLAGLGIAGRTAATRMGIRAADKAELIARNGGAISQAPVLSDDAAKYAAWLAAIQQIKYGNPLLGQN